MKQLMFICVVGALFTLNFAFTASAAVKSLGEFRDWQAYSSTEKGRTLCYVQARPQKAEGNYQRRGDISVSIAHRSWTKPKKINEIGFEAGYTFKKGSEVTVTIDRKKYGLFTDGDTAWNRKSKEDAAMVRAMRAGKQLIIQGISSRDNKTKDTYSLLGFTAAHNAINKACKVK